MGKHFRPTFALLSPYFRLALVENSVADTLKQIMYCKYFKYFKYLIMVRACARTHLGGGEERRRKERKGEESRGRRKRKGVKERREEGGGEDSHCRVAHASPGLAQA